MSLPTPNLDDRRFQDLVDDAKRLIAARLPEWTGLGPSDPGMVLVEVFAWMSEQIIYRLNQVPDVFYTRMLDLLGIQPFPPAAASTDVTFLLSPGHLDQVVVPAGTQIATGGREPVVFATTHELVIGQPELIAAATSRSEEHFVDLPFVPDVDRGAVSVFDDRPQPGHRFLLGFAGSLAGMVVELHVDVPADAAREAARWPVTSELLRWEVWEGRGWLPAAVRDDTTSMFVRPGVITLLVPAAHEPLTLGGTRAHWLQARLLPALPGHASLLSSPRVTSIQASVVGGTVAAEHSQTMPGEVLGVSDGRADQRYGTRVSPVLARRADETVRTFADGSTIDWLEVESFASSRPDDHHYTWDGASGEIRFGPRILSADGTVRQHGAVPPIGADVTVTSYRHGGGATGNVGAESLTVLRAPVNGIERVVNLLPAVGGADGETLDNLLRRGPMALRTGDQAITARDFERLVLNNVPSVARVRCLHPKEAGGPVRLLVVPRVGVPSGAAVVDDYAIASVVHDEIVAVLDHRWIVGMSVEVATPYYQGVTVAAKLLARPGRPVSFVRERALAAIDVYLDPLRGGRDGLGYPFDEDLDDTAIYRIVEKLEGVDRVEDVVLFEADLRNRQRVGFGRNSIALESDSLFLSLSNHVVVR